MRSARCASSSAGQRRADEPRPESAIAQAALTKVIGAPVHAMPPTARPSSAAASLSPPRIPQNRAMNRAMTSRSRPSAVPTSGPGRRAARPSPAILRNRAMTSNQDHRPCRRTSRSANGAAISAMPPDRCYPRPPRHDAIRINIAGPSLRQHVAKSRADRAPATGAQHDVASLALAASVLRNTASCS
jgi:hypothetical protein